MSEINQDYFSGSQASIFIGDLWVDEITDIQFSVGANATPIYGYGDTFFSHVAQGRVMVQGNLTINFKEPNYLFAVLERYKRFLSFEKDESTYLKDSYRNREMKNPYDDSDYKEMPKEIKLYEDKRNSLDEFFKGAGSAQTIEKLIKNRKLLTMDPKLVNDFALPLFDIKIGYGTTFDENTIGEQIVGVKLVGRGKAIMANGEPIKESYSFFARNLV